MNPRRLPAATEVAVTVLAALTTFFTLLSWDVLADDSAAYLVPLFWFCAGIGALGLALRTLRTPWPLVPVIQAAAVGLVVLGWWSTGTPLILRLPTPEVVADAVRVLERAAEQSRSYPAPVPATAVEFWPLMVAVGLVVALLVDFLACTLRRIPLAGLPLLAAFTVPVSIVGGVSWLTFAVAAISFVFLLTADQAARLGSWGRNVAGGAGEVTDNQPHEVRLGTLWPTATRVGIAGVGIAVLVPAVLPSGAGMFSGGGTGPGNGSNEVSIDNPMVDMKRDLEEREDFPVILVETDDPAPAYLRTTVLDEFDGAAWRPSERDIPEINGVAGGLPPVPGLDADTPRVSYDYRLSITDRFNSTWLPTPYPPTEVRAVGDWRYDVDTLDLAAVGDDTDANGLEYDVVGLDVNPSPASLVNAGLAPRQVALAGTELPDDMPEWIDEMASDVTAGSESDFESAVMLQDWFRETGGFDYSLAKGTGSGLEQLELFLSEEEGGRVGYCEQFASAMAMMARSLGIPARVAVGFLRPSPQSDGSWLYSSHDQHSWPELYFDGAGWIRFEPTPQDRTANAVPAYTAGRVPAPELGANPSASASVSGGAAERAANRQQTNTAAEEQTTSTSSDSPWFLWLVGAAVLLVALLAAPRVARTLVRRRRYAGDDPQLLPEGAWAEVRATAIDLGRRWPEGLTLRRQARLLVPALGTAPLGPLETLVLLVERSRYSRAGLSPEETDEVRALSGAVTTAMVEAADRSARRRATWLPRSLVGAGRRSGRRQVGPLRRRGRFTTEDGAPNRVVELEEVSL